MLVTAVSLATTILGSGETELLTSNGLDVSGYVRLSFILKNTGADNVTALAVYWATSPDGATADWSPPDQGVTLPLGVLGPGETLDVTFTDLSRSLMRITATGTSGQSVRLTLSGTWV